MVLKKFSGNIVDICNMEINPGSLIVSNGRIKDIVLENREFDRYIIPGFVDSHIHIESSMLPPAEFARIATVHGTVAAVSDPHEIANVLGIEGIDLMIESASTVPFKFYFGAPSCVPATPFESNGAILDLKEIEQLLKMDEIKCLGEMMNIPGVIAEDPTVWGKIQLAKKYSKLIDGHAPGLRGEDLEHYIGAGISTDHECNDPEEALEKIMLGMKVQIREGSSARNFDELIPIVEKNHDRCMFCSDDLHPDDLIKGHMNILVKRAIEYGIDIFKVLKVATVNPVLHYGLDVGLLRIGDWADFLVIDDLQNFNILKTIINGEIVASGGRPLISRNPPKVMNNFRIGVKGIQDYSLHDRDSDIFVIEAIDKQLITRKRIFKPSVIDGNIVSDIQRDILKIVVVNRYTNTRPAIGFVKNFGLKRGAMASSIAHDSHNIIGVGVDDKDLCRAVNVIVENKGGICIVADNREMVLPLPIAGIMSNDDHVTVAEKYGDLDKEAKSLGSTLTAPFMTLSFMALPVIPELKLSDKGLVDAETFNIISIYANSD